MREAEDNLFDSDRREVKFVFQLVINPLIGLASFNEFVETSEDSFVSPLS